MSKPSSPVMEADLTNGRKRLSGHVVGVSHDSVRIEVEGVIRVFDLGTGRGGDYQISERALGLLREIAQGSRWIAPKGEAHGHQTYISAAVKRGRSAMQIARHLSISKTSVLQEIARQEGRR